jgi:hypothetical protein
VVFGAKLYIQCWHLRLRGEKMTNTKIKERESRLFYTSRDKVKDKVQNLCNVTVNKDDLSTAYVEFDALVTQSKVYEKDVYSIRDQNGDNFRHFFTRMCKFLGAQPGDKVVIKMSKKK